MRHRPLGVYLTRSLTRAALACLLALGAHPQRAAAQATASVPAVNHGRLPRVLAPDGRPVAGATVSFVGHDELTPGTVVLRTATTAGDGSFDLPPSADGKDPTARSSARQVIVEAPGHGLTGGSVRRNVLSDVRLKPATELRVQVLGPDGKPAAGLRVAPRTLVGRGTPGKPFSWFVNVPDSLQERLARQTGADGMLVLPGLPQEATATLEVLGDDRYAMLNHKDQVPLDAAPVTQAKPLKLRPGASVGGRIAYGDGGKPVAGAVVHAQAAGRDTSGWGAATSDADGSYRITGLDPGQYNLYVKLPEALTRDWAVAAIEKVAVHEGGRLEGQDLKLVRGGVLKGKVIGSDTKLGLAGVNVGLYGPARPRSSAGIQSTSTAADGSFSFRVPPGRQYVYVSGFVPDGYVRPRGEASQEPTVDDGQEVEVTIQLPRDPNPPVAGRVLLPDGKPAAGAWVTADVGGPFGDGRGVEADRDGRFRFAALSPRAQLRAALQDLESAEAVAVRGGEEDLVLHLQPRDKSAGSLKVIVHDAAGKPVPGAQVKLSVQTGEFGIQSTDPAWVTGADGTYLFKELSPTRRYRLWIEADGFGVGQGDVPPLKAGELTEAGPVVMKRADARIAGRVVSKDGQPLAGISVEINGSETGLQRTRTDAAGRFEFKVIPGASPLIWMRNDDDKSVGVRNAKAGQEELELVYDPKAVLK